MNAIAATTMPMGGMPSTSAIASTSEAGGSSGLFGDLINRFVGEANTQQMSADQSVQDLALGKTDSMHGVLLEVAKADLAFRLVLEIRNRLSEAYQEVAKMPM